MGAEQEPNKWDYAVFARLSGLIGQEKARGIASRFADDLWLRFRDPTDTKLLEKEAHITNSSAGMLGFADLSNLSRNLETACQAGSGVVEALAAVSLAKQAVIDVLNDHLGAGPPLNPASFVAQGQVQADHRTALD